jgi:TonB family protein
MEPRCDRIFLFLLPNFFSRKREMRFPKILPALLVSLFFVSLLSANETSDRGLYTFYGQVQLIDPAKKVIVIQSHKEPLVFHYNEQTRISSTLGEVHMDKVVRGTAAAVVMRLGEGNIGIATEIRFVPGHSAAQTLALISARTVQGETINGAAVGKFVTYKPPSEEWSGAVPLARRNNAGLFVLSVAPDGTVASVTARQSTGYPELDARAERWMKKWRFNPHTLTEVRLPMFFYETRN